MQTFAIDALQRASAELALAGALAQCVDRPSLCINLRPYDPGSHASLAPSSVRNSARFARAGHRRSGGRGDRRANDRTRFGGCFEPDAAVAERNPVRA